MVCFSHAVLEGEMYQLSHMLTDQKSVIHGLQEMSLIDKGTCINTRLRFTHDDKGTCMTTTEVSTIILTLPYDMCMHHLCTCGFGCTWISGNWSVFRLLISGESRIADRRLSRRGPPEKFGVSVGESRGLCCTCWSLWCSSCTELTPHRKCEHLKIAKFCVNFAH